MGDKWTVHSIADWAVQVGLQPKLLNAGNGVMLYQPGEKRAIFGIYLPTEGAYLVEVGFNPDNEQSWRLRELLQPHFDEVDVDEGSRKWPRIGVAKYSDELLNQIAAWAGEYIVSPWTPKPKPVPIAGPESSGQLEASTTVTMLSASATGRRSTKAEATFQKFAEWKSVLLSNRGLEHPDGRALYLYRLTEDEFNDLEQLLNKWLAMLLPRYGLARVADLTGFPALFVMYAAEWWRRRYDGSGFSWEPILRNLGANPDDWSPGQRSDYVQRGLRDWHLKPRERGALRFLGSVAVQGGLPLRLLATARGGIGHLLSRVLQLAAGTQVTQADLQTWVESLATMLPNSYRQATIFALLADVAWAVLMLKQQAGLTSSSDAVAVLDQKVAGWRDRFPLPVDDDHAQGMIEQLIRDAASVRAERRAMLLPLERLLDQESENRWTIRSRLTLTAAVQADQLAKLFGVTADELPRTAELSLAAKDNQQRTSLRRLAGNNAYRVERKPWGWLGEDAASEHVLRMSSPDGRVWSVTATKGEALDDELPWVFVEADGAHLLARQGSGSVAATEALVALPADWQIDSTAESDLTSLGTLSSPERRILRVQGTIRAHRADGTGFRLRTGHAGATEEEFGWGGNRYWLDFYSPSIAFRGFPSLYRIADDGTRRKVDGRPACSVMGAPNAEQALGPAILRYPATGEIKYRSRMLLLPKQADMSLEPYDAVSGAIRFHDWGIASARVLTPGTRQQLREVDGNAVLEVTVAPGSLVPDLVDIEVFWPHSTSAAKLRVPFPAKGVRAFDSRGRELLDDSLLAVQNLAGTRLLIAGVQSNGVIWLEISIGRGRAVRRHKLHTRPDALSLELRLQDFASDIHHLLSTNDSPDARVKVAIKVQGERLFRINLARYAAILECEGDVVRLDTEALKSLRFDEVAALPVSAIRLEHPGDEPISLPACVSEEVATGAWRFSPERREPGNWLIYPGPNALLPFRPTLWPIEGDSGDSDRLVAAMGIPRQLERENAIDEVIDALAANFDDPIWTGVEQLASQIGHLPLATLDLWRRFAHSAPGMAALALRFGTLPAEFLERFAQELPFAWEAIPFRAWHDAMERLKMQFTGSFGDDAGATIFRSHLDTCIKTLSSTNSAITFLLGIAGSDHLPESKKEVGLLKFLGKQAHEILFVGEGSRLMALRRIHADDQWPADFNAILTSIDGKPPIVDYLYQRDVGFQTGVINMPLLLAVQAATNQTDYWFANPGSIHVLRGHRAFDPEWFDEAYNQTVAHCLADGLLENE